MKSATEKQLNRISTSRDNRDADGEDAWLKEMHAVLSPYWSARSIYGSQPSPQPRS